MPAGKHILSMIASHPELAETVAYKIVGIMHCKVVALSAKLVTTVELSVVLFLYSLLVF
jgi:hypothetical protein